MCVCAACVCVCVCVCVKVTETKRAHTKIATHKIVYYTYLSISLRSPSTLHSNMTVTIRIRHPNLCHPQLVYGCVEWTLTVQTVSSLCAQCTQRLLSTFKNPGQIFPHKNTASGNCCFLNTSFVQEGRPFLQKVEETKIKTPNRGFCFAFYNTPLVSF